MLDGAADAQLVMNDIKAAGVPVIIHPTMARAGGDTEGAVDGNGRETQGCGHSRRPAERLRRLRAQNPRRLYSKRAWPLQNGLSQRDALALITIDAAKILGLDNRIGSLAVGKDADLALYDGDPLEWTTHCVGTIINGVLVNKVTR